MSKGILVYVEGILDVLVDLVDGASEYSIDSCETAVVLFVEQVFPGRRVTRFMVTRGRLVKATMSLERDMMLFRYGRITILYQLGLATKRSSMHIDGIEYCSTCWSLVGSSIQASGAGRSRSQRDSLAVNIKQDIDEVVRRSEHASQLRDLNTASMEGVS